MFCPADGRQLLNLAQGGADQAPTYQCVECGNLFQDPLLDVHDTIICRPCTISMMYQQPIVYDGPPISPPGSP